MTLSNNGINPKLNVCYKRNFDDGIYFFVIGFRECEHSGRSCGYSKCKGRMITFPPQLGSCFRSGNNLIIEEVGDEG